MKCKKQIQKGSITKRCGNNARDGKDFCRVHDVEVLHEVPHEVPQDVKIPYTVQQDVQMQNFELQPGDTGIMLNAIMDTLTQLKLSVDEIKPKNRKPKHSPVITRAKWLFYHEAKKDVKFVESVKFIYPNLSKVPWQLIKEKSDLYWDTIDQEMRDNYIKMALSNL